MFDIKSSWIKNRKISLLSSHCPIIYWGVQVTQELILESLAGPMPTAPDDGIHLLGQKGAACKPYPILGNVCPCSVSPSNLYPFEQ